MYIVPESATEYARSKYTKRVRSVKKDLFKAKAKAAAVIGTIIENARNGMDEVPKRGHKRVGMEGVFPTL